MKFIAEHYTNKTEETRGFERTTRIYNYLTFADIKELKDEWEINDKIEIPDPWFVEEVLSKLIGYKVELVDRKLRDLNDDDYLRVGRDIRPVLEALLESKKPGIKVPDFIAAEYYKTEINQFVKKLEFRVVVPHQLEIIKQRLAREPVSIDTYKNSHISVPSFHNIDSKYSKKDDGSEKITVEDLKNHIKIEEMKAKHKGKRATKDIGKGNNYGRRKE